MNKLSKLITLKKRHIFDCFFKFSGSKFDADSESVVKIVYFDWIWAWKFETAKNIENMLAVWKKTINYLKAIKWLYILAQLTELYCKIIS